jgi:hypothetical protein
LRLIDSVNKTNNLYQKVIEEEKSDKLQKENEKIYKNNYRLILQEYFYNEFKKQNNTEATKKYFNTLENRLNVIESVTLGDENSTPFINSIYNNELNFIYNIFKKDEEAQDKTTENQIFIGIQQTYKKHGIDAYYKLLDVQDNFLSKYNINNSKYHIYYNKTNKYFYNMYKTIYKNELEEKKQNNSFLYFGSMLVGALIGTSSGIKKTKNRRSQWRF